MVFAISAADNKVTNLEYVQRSRNSASKNSTGLTSSEQPYCTTNFPTPIEDPVADLKYA